MARHQGAAKTYRASYRDLPLINYRDGPMLLPFVWSALADLPVHCVHPQIVGNWTFRVGKSSASRPACGHSAPDRNDDHLGRPPSALLPRARHAGLVTRQLVAVLRLSRGSLRAALGRPIYSHIAK